MLDELLCFLALCGIVCGGPQVSNVCSSLEGYSRLYNKEESSDCWYDPDVPASEKELALLHGFLLEKHPVLTDDGYILTLFRLKNLNGTYGKETVFLQHGLATDATCFMINKGNSISFYLAKRNFDVWLGNYRGTVFSGHKKLAKSDPEYWNFSFHEHGLYDLPASLRYVGKKTSQKIIYIGHSMGGTGMGIYAAMKPKHAKEHIKKAILINPALYLGHVKGLAVNFLNRTYDSMLFTPLLNLKVINEPDGLLNNILHPGCSFSVRNGKFCLDILNDIIGEFLIPLRWEGFPLLQKVMRNACVKSLLHYLQLIRSGKFQMFDYGPEQNSVRYNSEIPPEYNLTEVTIPFSLIYGTTDNLVTKEDTINTFNKFHKANWKIYEMPHNHMDFLCSQIANNTILPLLSKIIKRP